MIMMMTPPLLTGSGAPGPKQAAKKGRARRSSRGPRRLWPKPCEECGETTKAKGLCPKHYGLMMRQRRRKPCTLEECDNPKRFRSKLYCEEHFGCTAPECRESFKARRLCSKHYGTMYLTPKRREEREREKDRQGKFDIEDGNVLIPKPEEDLPVWGIRLDRPNLPIHRQVGARAEQVRPYQIIADALTLLKTNGVLPSHMVEHGRRKTVRMLSEHLNGKTFPGASEEETQDHVSIK